MCIYIYIYIYTLYVYIIYIYIYIYIIHTIIYYNRIVVPPSEFRTRAD